MDVQYTLDNEDGIDPTDPLGNLTIRDDKGFSLFLAETFIDVWLISLIRAIVSIRSRESLKVEVLEEPYFILITEDNGFLNLECEGRSIRLNSEKARHYFIESAKSLVDELSKYDGHERNAAIDELRALISI